MAFLTSGDINHVLIEDREFQLRSHQKRGYRKWFTFWVKRRFLFVSWWSFDGWSHVDEPFIERMRMAKEFDKKYGLTDLKDTP